MAKSFEEITKMVANLEAIRDVRMEKWRELSEWLVPHRGIFDSSSTNSSTRKNISAFNGPVITALAKTASGLTSGMTPQAMRWFNIGFQNIEDYEATGARAFADEVARRIGIVLEKGNFYQAIYAFNTDFVGFACGLLFADSSETTILRFEAVQVGTFAVALDPEGNLDTVVRRIRYTPQQLRSKFGDSVLSDKVKNALNNYKYDPVEIVHIVTPREGADVTKIDAKNMRYASYFYEADGGEDFLHEGGYHEMPYFFKVWEEGRNPYGTGIGDNVLPDAKGLDKLERKKYIGLDKYIDPPMQIPAGYKNSLDTRPGGRNEFHSLLGGDGMVKPVYALDFGRVFTPLQAEIENVNSRINALLYTTLFDVVPIDMRPKDMSATEYLSRKREALQLLGPTLNSYDKSVLDPLITRVYNAIDRAGLLPLPPQGLAQSSGGLKVEYISPLSQAMQQTGAETTRAIIQDVAILAQVNPEVTDKLDTDQAIDEIANGIGVPGRVIRSDEEVAAIRQSRAAAQQQQQANMEAMQAVQTAESMANIAATEITDNSLAKSM